MILAAAVVVLTSLDLFLFRAFSNADDGIYDTLIKYRFSSPKPSPDVLIVDIDERSLEIVGRDHGRWPWPRAVVAEAIAAIGEAKPKSLIVNVLFSEPVLDDPAGDEVLNLVADAYPQTIFPFVRLPPVSDSQSQLDAALIPAARPRPTESPNVDDRVAVILPGLAGLQKRLGASNLESDSDGIVRAYRYWYATSAHEIPSLAAAALLYGNGIESFDSGKRLNWRNKKGDYHRVSFADLYLATQGNADFDWGVFDGKYVVMGPTAPGISVIKPTAARPITDDNTIIATAIDDQLSATGLDVVPDWALAIAAVLVVCLLSWAFMAEISEALIDGLFVVSQAFLVVITFWSVSYSYRIVDLTLVFNAGMLFFLVARSFLVAKRAAELGSELFWSPDAIKDAEYAVTVLSPIGQKYGAQRSINAMTQRQLEKICGKNRVFRFRSLVDEGTFFGPVFEGKELLIGFLGGDPSGLEKDFVQALKNPEISWRLEPIKGLEVKEIRRRLWKSIGEQLVA
ncbi:MAG: CHASE2 domain-containing protein [Steroidobacteraceae bacterium]